MNYQYAKYLKLVESWEVTHMSNALSDKGDKNVVRSKLFIFELDAVGMCITSPSF